MKKTFEIPVDSFRKIPNPYKEGPSSVSQMYTAICDVKDLPEDLIDWMERRGQRKRGRKPKEPTPEEQKSSTWQLAYSTGYADGYQKALRKALKMLKSMGAKNEC